MHRERKIILKPRSKTFKGVRTSFNVLIIMNKRSKNFLRMLYRHVLCARFLISMNVFELDSTML